MLLLLFLCAQVTPEPALHVHNPAACPQRCVLAASFPLPRHWAARSLRGVHVGDAPAHCTPLLRWPDGTLAVVQLQWQAELGAGASYRVLVRCEPSGETLAADEQGVAAPTDPWPDELPLHTEVTDPWGRVYVARPRALTSTRAGLVCCQRLRATHIEPASGAGLFDVHVYLTRRAAEPFGELTLVLDNGRDDGAPACGPARFARFTLVSEDARLRFRPQFAAENLLPAPTAELDAAGEVRGFRQDLLGPSAVLYLGDGTAKAFRFDVCFADALPAAASDAIQLRFDEPPSAFADLDWVRHTGVYGLHGGPAPMASRLDDLTAAVVGGWQRHAQFGPFGAFGEAKEAAAIGAPHSGAMALHNVVRWRSAELLRLAQARVLQGALRPLPGWRPRLPEVTAALRQGLSARAIARPHGFEALDYEHVSVDLPFETYWLTGDPFALDELRRHGGAIRALLAHLPFLTSRGEGCCARAIAAIAWCTGDSDLLAWSVQRMHERVLPELSRSAVVALAQPPSADALGADAPFDAPWQMAALVHGLHALHRLSGDGALAAAAVEVARRMATAGWVEGRGPKYFVHAGTATRFCMPRDYLPLHGTARFEIGAFVLAGELARDDADLQRLFAARAADVVGAARDARGILPPALRADTWFQLWLDRGGR